MYTSDILKYEKGIREYIEYVIEEVNKLDPDQTQFEDYVMASLNDDEGIHMFRFSVTVNCTIKSRDLLELQQTLYDDQQPEPVVYNRFSEIIILQHYEA